MKTTAIWCLVVVNTLLAALLIQRYVPGNYAQAQLARPGDYLCVPVDFPGARTGAVVVLNSTDGELSAIMTDENQKRMEGMAPIRLADLFDRAATGGRKPR